MANMTYKKDPYSGSEEWYDENGNLIHIICRYDDKIEEEWFDCDENGNIIHMKKSNGYEVWHRYDENGKRVYRKVSYRNIINEMWYEYSWNGKYCIHMTNSRGYEEYYDRNGNIIAIKEPPKHVKESH